MLIKLRLLIIPRGIADSGIDTAMVIGEQTQLLLEQVCRNSLIVMSLRVLPSGG